MQEKLKKAIVSELERQAQENHYDAPWVDTRLRTGYVFIDGEVSLNDLASAIFKALALAE